MPATAEHYALGGQVSQRMGDRGPAQAEPLAQLMLGGQAAVRPVGAAQDLLGEQGLELLVQRDRLVSCQIHRVPVLMRFGRRRGGSTQRAEWRRGVPPIFLVPRNPTP